jgi:hypothetical protein
MIPEPYPLTHHTWVQNVPNEEDAHGNPKGHWVPIARRFNAMEQQQTREVVGTNTVATVVTDLVVTVADASLYSDQDQVTINGKRYRVDGDPGDERMGPLPQYNSMFGGVLRLKRVT